MLIPSSRHTPEDLAHWETLERQDRAHSTRLEPRIRAAMTAIEAFLRDGLAYVGVSWGKDSTVLADLICRAGMPLSLVWVRVERIFSPECLDVRDAFFRLHPDAGYHEVRVPLWWDPEKDGGKWRKTGTLERGFAEAVRLTETDRYISGVRAEESAKRKRRLAAFGISTERTCAPLSRWTSDDVFAYLYAFRLPVHPAYAMSMGGRLERGRLRVSFLGMQCGSGRGKLEWEHAYYPEMCTLVTPGKEVTPVDFT